MVITVDPRFEPSLQAGECQVRRQAVGWIWLSPPLGCARFFALVNFGEFLWIIHCDVAWLYVGKLLAKHENKHQIERVRCHVGILYT